MAADSLALLRNRTSKELQSLADEHFKHDLTDVDRDNLEAAARRVSTWTTVGSLVGLGLGALLAYRVRTVRAQWFRAFRAMEKPVEVRFKDGRTEPIPDLTPLLEPSPWGDMAAFVLFPAGGLFLGGELGLLGGGASAARKINADMDSRMRIERAFRRFRADVLRKELERLERKDAAGAGAAAADAAGWGSGGGDGPLGLY